MRVGIVGCGHVSSQYFEGLRQHGDLIEIVACADADHTRARAQAERFGIPQVLAPDELIADGDVDLVVNLTPPTSHFEVSAEAIRHGKHVYSEKPLATTTDDALVLVQAAREASVLLGCAPDTFLGGGIQTALKLIDDGWIGTPHAGVAFVSEPGYEHFHPNVDFFYQPGGGPMLDLGPYYITALVNIFGSVARVSGLARITFPERTVRVGDRAGSKIVVRTPTHITGALEFVGGGIVTVLASWDIAATGLPYLEVYGDRGSISLPNPDLFGGSSRIRITSREDFSEPPPPPGTVDWTEVPLSFPDEFGRGLGVADMARALRDGRPHRASGDLALHVLEVLTAFQRSSDGSTHIPIDYQCPAPARLGLDELPRFTDT